MTSMTIDEIQALAGDIKNCYREMNEQVGNQPWGARDYADGMTVDVGALVKMLMVRDQLRHGEDDDLRIAHELSDIVWSAFAIANELGIDLAQELPRELAALRGRFD